MEISVWGWCLLVYLGYAFGRTLGREKARRELRDIKKITSTYKGSEKNREKEA